MRKATTLVMLLFSFSVFASFPVWGQQKPPNSPLLDHLSGKWTLRGTVAGQQTIDADWVLDHHDLRIHEISREKDSNGKPK